MTIKDFLTDGPGTRAGQQGAKLLAAVNKNAQTGDAGHIHGRTLRRGRSPHSRQSRMPLNCPVGLPGQAAEVFTSAYGLIRSPVGIIHSAAFDTPSNGPDYIESNAVHRRHPTFRAGSPRGKNTPRRRDRSLHRRFELSSLAARSLRCGTKLWPPGLPARPNGCIAP